MVFEYRWTYKGVIKNLVLLLLVNFFKEGLYSALLLMHCCQERALLNFGIPFFQIRLMSQHMFAGVIMVNVLREDCRTDCSICGCRLIFGIIMAALALIGFLFYIYYMYSK